MQLLDALEASPMHIANRVINEGHKRLTLLRLGWEEHIVVDEARNFIRNATPEEWWDKLDWQPEEVW